MKLTTLAAAALLALLIPAGGVMAEGVENPFSRGCGEFSSGKAFVTAAAYYCMGQKDAQGCQTAAERYFSACGFPGSFQKINREAYTGMLFMFVVAKAPQSASSLRRE